MIKKKTNVPIDVLRRDSKLAGVPREEKNEEKVLTFREDGNIKAVKFVLAAHFASFFNFTFMFNFSSSLHAKS